MERLIKGALAFTRGARQEFLKQVQTRYSPLGVMVSCVDARVSPSKFMSSQPGELYVIRNAGNFAPEYGGSGTNTVLSTLELSCLHGPVKNIIVCGHSDCKAMHLLTSVGPEVSDGKLTAKQMSPLQQWIAGQGLKGWTKWRGKTNAIRFPALDEQLTLNMRSDAIKSLEEVDVLSQINVLQQMSNIYSYPLLAEKLATKAIRVHGFWFCLHSGEVYLFSPQKESFVAISEETLPELLRETSK